MTNPITPPPELAMHFRGVPLIPPLDCTDPQSWIAEQIYQMGAALVQPEPQPPAAIVEMVNKLHQINNSAPLAKPEPVDLLARIDTLLDGIDRDECHPDGGWWQTSDGSKFGRIKLRELKELVSAAHLAQPDPVPTDEEIEEAAKLIHASMRFAVPDNHYTRDWVERGNSLMQDEARRTARAVLARWGTPAIQPVPVAERPWEREGWCDAEGQCWMGDPGGAGFIPSWRLCRPEDAPSMTCSLPHHALPTPEANL
jgi:hypothetical protein